MGTVMPHERDRSVPPTRVLLAVHGGEPDGWGRETGRTVARWATPSVRILGVLAVPCPPFTSLIPPAARMYRAARAAWRDVEEKRVQRVIDDMLTALPGRADVVWAPVSYGDPGPGIAAHARAWAADVVVMAVSPAASLWLGAVHDRILRLAGCPVLLTPPGGSR